jgi:hypothetical protein
MDGEKIKLKKEAISEILVAETDSESGAEASKQLTQKKNLTKHLSSDHYCRTYFVYSRSYSLL